MILFCAVGTGSSKKTKHNDVFSSERGLSMLTGRRYPGRNPLSGRPLPSSYLWSWSRWLNGALSSSKFMLRSSVCA